VLEREQAEALLLPPTAGGRPWGGMLLTLVNLSVAGAVWQWGTPARGSLQLAVGLSLTTLAAALLVPRTVRATVLAAILVISGAFALTLESIVPA